MGLISNFSTNSMDGTTSGILISILGDSNSFLDGQIGLIYGLTHGHRPPSWSVRAMCDDSETISPNIMLDLHWDRSQGWRITFRRAGTNDSKHLNKKEFKKTSLFPVW